MIGDDHDVDFVVQLALLELVQKLEQDGVDLFDGLLQFGRRRTELVTFVIDVLVVNLSTEPPPIPLNTSAK